MMPTLIEIEYIHGPADGMKDRVPSDMKKTVIRWRGERHLYEIINDKAIYDGKLKMGEHI